MKTTLITTFTFALMVLVFNTNPVMAGALSDLWSSNESVDELRDPDEDNTSKTAFGGWQAVLEACKDENGDWDTDACPYLAKGDVEKALASWDDDEKADQYGNDWFNETGDESEIAWVCGTMGGVPTCCDQNPNGSVVCVSPFGNEAGNESQIAGYGDIGWDEFYEFCQQYPDMTLCLNEWQNEDAESRDGFGGRAVADSGNEGSTSAASAGDQ